MAIVPFFAVAGQGYTTVAAFTGFFKILFLSNFISSTKMSMSFLLVGKPTETRVAPRIFFKNDIMS
jgi:hypothetical protein